MSQDGTTRDAPAPSPAFGVRIRVPARALIAVAEVASEAPGGVERHAAEPVAAGVWQVTLDTDSESTLHWLVGALHSRLGVELLRADDPVFAAASTGKVGQQACVTTATGRDLALADVAADRRVVEHIVAHPYQADRLTGRSRRVALVTDGSAVLNFEPIEPQAALPAVESQALLLHLATGLDVVPLPLAARDPAELAGAVGMIAPGFAAVVVVHTQRRRVDAVRAANTSGSLLLLDAVNDGFAVAATAAALNHLRSRGIDPTRSRVAVVDPARGGDLAGMLVAAGVGDLILYDPVEFGIQPLHQRVGPLDLIVDLIGLAAPPEGTPLLRARPETPRPFDAATTNPRPLHALPGLLRAVVATRRPVTLEARLAAVRVLVDLTPRGALLPELDLARLTPAVAAAATHVLAVG